MTVNKALSAIFDHMADLYLLRGKEEDRFRITSYRRIAQTLRYLPQRIEELDKKNALMGVPGIGPHIASKIHEFLTIGSIATYEKLKGHFPESLLKLMEIPSLGPKKVQLLWKELGVTDADSLKRVLKDGSAEQLPGFGQKTVENILKGMELGDRVQKRKFIALMVPVVAGIKQYLEKSGLVEQVEIAGSFRRKEETVGDLDFLATSTKPRALVDYFVNHPEVKQVLAHGDTKGSVIMEEGLQVDLRVVKHDEWGAALQYFTGSKDHNVHLRSIAREKGMTVNEYGVFQLTKTGEKGKKIGGTTEQEVYNLLGMQWIPPEMRTDTGEIPAALSKKKLPELISYRSLHGDLHAHTTYSDGVSTVLQMAKKADDLGLQYLALTDHSPSLKVANGVSVKKLSNKLAEMKEVQNKVKVRLLFGTEVDILPDGSIDYPDKILSQFDVVVASVHSGFTKDNTKRILKAMENRYVSIIGHLSGRMLGKREGYPIDYDQIFDQAVKTKTWIEINAQPHRQDISWDHIRRGKEKGVQFVISTDSHTKETLWFLDLGIGIARRGWLEKKDIVNTLPVKDFVQALHTQREWKLRNV